MVTATVILQTFTLTELCNKEIFIQHFKSSSIMFFIKLVLTHQEKK